MAIGYQGGNDVVVSQLFQPMIRTMGQNILYQQEQDKLKRAEKSKLSGEIQKDLSKVNSNGLRNADLPEFNKMYTDVKDKYAAFNSSKDPNEQRAIAMQLNQDLGNINALVANSKEIATFYNEATGRLSSLVGKGKVEEARNHILSSNSKPSSQLGREYFDTSVYLNTYDPTKILNEYKAIGSTFAKNDKNYEVVQEYKGGIQTLGGNKFADRVTEYIPNGAKILEDTSQFFKSTPQRKAMLDDYMAERGITDINQGISTFATENMDSFSKASSRERISANDSSPTFNVNLNDVPERVKEGTSSWALGKLSSKNATTFNNNFTLQGAPVIYDMNGSPIKQGRSVIDIKGINLVELPVDRQGNPLPEGDPRAVANREFVTGEAYDPTESRVRTSAGSRFNKDIAIPYNNQNFLNMSKREEEGVIGKRNQGRVGTSTRSSTKREPGILD